MRISFSDIARPKAAAKQLSRLSSNVTLARAHEAVARATGYRDCHELASSSDAPEAQNFSVSTLTQVVLSLSDALGLEVGDVQFAISKARLVGSGPWSIADQLALYLAVVRERFLGVPARGKPGTIVRAKANGQTETAYLLRAGRPTHLLFDQGKGERADFQISTPRTPLADFLPARLWLPYGYWTLRDGSEVAFARDYLPLWRIAGGMVERINPWLWIQGIKSERWFAPNTEGDWWCPAGRVPALAYLEKHRIFGLPKLANCMRYMFEPGSGTVEDAARRMFENEDNNAPLPEFAALNSNLLHDWRASRTSTGN